MLSIISVSLLSLSFSAELNTNGINGQREKDEDKLGCVMN